MIYLTSQWFPQQNRASIMGLFYMGAPLALTLGSPLSGALLEMHGFMGHPGWFWMFIIEGCWRSARGSSPSSGSTIRRKRRVS
jgi:MFS family permease